MQKIRNFSLDQAVRATAGAGKTTGLISAVESCYRSHLSKTGALPHILLTTFTIKAANELSERLLDYALKKNDEEFLNYVSSHFLEIGTMHSTFMKVLGAISQDEGDEDLKSFTSIKYFHARSCLHKVLNGSQKENIFDYIGDDKLLAQTFIQLFESNHLSLDIVNSKILIENLVEQLKSAIDIGPEEYIGDVRSLFVKIEVFIKENQISSDSEIDLFFEYLNQFKESMMNKVSQKCKRDEKSYYRKIVKLLSVPEAEVDFFKTYINIHKELYDCFNQWKLEYELVLENDLGYGISDIEWRLYNQLLTMDETVDLWDYCFFDEYQDTSPIQKKVIESLTQNTPCYFVGDPFQSIYYFRGARKDIFLEDFAKVEVEGGRAEFRLDNYRSSPAVVNFVNTICEARLEGFKPMQTRKTVDGLVEVYYNEASKLEDELHFIFSKIKNVDLKKESFAILGRNAKELMICAKFLKERGISASTSLSKSFESSLEVVDLAGVLNFIHYPHDNSNFISLMRSPWFESSDEDIRGFQKKINNGEASSLWELYKQEKTDSLFHKLVEEFKTLNSNEVLVNFITYSNFLSLTDHIDSTGKRELNVWKFIGILQREEDSMSFDARAFIQDILGGLYPLEKDSTEPEIGCVLMTVHASKGLQFDYVAILAANKSFSARSGNLVIDEKSKLFSMKVYNEQAVKKVFPDFFESSILKDKHEIAQESRRLLYVAMTRAVKCLYISGSGVISKTPFEPSWMKIVLDFVDEADFSLIDECEKFENNKDNVEYDLKGFILNKEQQAVNKAEGSSVTEQISLDSEKQTSLHSSLSNLSSNIVKGTLFHEFVERSGANGNSESIVNNFFLSEAEQNHTAYKYLEEQTEFPFNELMESGEKEWGFDYIDEEDKFSSGKIDLWGQTNDVVWIVDFKTGQSKYRDKGFKQLELYTGVLKQALNNPALKFKLVLTFPFIKETEIREV